MSVKATDVEETTATRIPVSRDYDFEKRVQTGLPPYYSHNGEFDRIMAEIQWSGRLPRFLIGGPTACGKTHLARYIAQELVYGHADNGSETETYFQKDLEEAGLDIGDTCPVTESIIEEKTGCPLISVQCKYSLNEADLLGMPNIDAEKTYWQDGPVTKSLLASVEGPVVLLLDEVNRSRPESKSALFSVLDDRAEIALDGRGGELVQGVAENLISIATINEGPGYFVERMDLAEKRRLGIKFDVDFLGSSRPDAERDLIIERSNVHEGLAELMVSTANTIRSDLAKSDSSPVRTGVPTGMVISWGQTALAYEAKGISNPLFEAAEDVIIRPFYGDEDGESEVRETFNSHVHDVPVDEEEFIEATENENESTGDSPDNASRYDELKPSNGMDVQAMVDYLDNGGDPHDLQKQGATPQDVMTAMSRSSLY